MRKAADKIVRRSILSAVVDEAKRSGKRVVSTNGCFDILHVGHIRYLQQARELGDVLVVGVNSDDSVRKLKGPGRPLVPSLERAEVLAALECVDYVTIFDEDTPVELLARIKPSVHVKGGDYRVEDLPEAAAMRSIGGDVVVIPYESTHSEGKSTTGLVDRMTNSDQEA